MEVVEFGVVLLSCTFVSLQLPVLKVVSFVKNSFAVNKTDFVFVFEPEN